MDVEFTLPCQLPKELHNFITQLYQVTLERDEWNDLATSHLPLPYPITAQHTHYFMMKKKSNWVTHVALLWLEDWLGVVGLTTKPHNIIGVVPHFL